MKNNISAGLLILRVSIGILIMLHGIAKVKKGVSGLERTFENMDLPGALAYLVYVGEIIAPIMLILGWRTKIAAFFVAMTMVVAVWLRHADDIDKLARSGGWAIELPALFFFASVALMITGGGRYAMSYRNRWD